MAGVTPALVTGGPSSKWNDTVDTLHSRVGGRIGRAGNTGTSKKTTLRPKQRTGRKEGEENGKNTRTVSEARTGHDSRHLDPNSLFLPFTTQKEEMTNRVLLNGTGSWDPLTQGQRTVGSHKSTTHLLCVKPTGQTILSNPTSKRWIPVPGKELPQTQRMVMPCTYKSRSRGEAYMRGLAKSLRIGL